MCLLIDSRLGRQKLKLHPCTVDSSLSATVCRPWAPHLFSVGSRRRRDQPQDIAFTSRKGQVQGWGKNSSRGLFSAVLDAFYITSVVICSLFCIFCNPLNGWFFGKGFKSSCAVWNLGHDWNFNHLNPTDWYLVVKILQKRDKGWNYSAKLNTHLCRKNKKNLQSWFEEAYYSNILLFLLDWPAIYTGVTACSDVVSTSELD